MFSPTARDLPCHRVACRQSPAPCVHTQTGDHYCVSCARKINKWAKADEGIDELVTIPEEYKRVPQNRTL